MSVANVNVNWVTFHDGIDCRGYWDQALLEDLFSGALGRVPGFEFQHFETYCSHDDVWPKVSDPDGGIFVVPARHHASEEDVVAINRMLAAHSWVLLILTGDEEAVFPVNLIGHPNMRIWVQNPRPGGRFPGDTVFLPCGYAKNGKLILDELHRAAPDGIERDLDWFFSGQVTNPRREQCAFALRRLQNGELMETEGFGQGLDVLSYFAHMRRAKVVPAPSGPATTDTFRACEALEAGAVPLLDNNDPRGRSGVWDLIFPEHLRPPMIVDWEQVEFHIGQMSSVAVRNQVFSKWQRYKRHLRFELARQLRALGAPELTEPFVSSMTAVIVTSPIEQHPSTELLRETIDSIRAHDHWCEILVMFDGVRPEHKGLEERYQEYVNRALHMLNSEYREVIPFVAKEHRHQSGLMRWALEEVRTPLVLFMEHDTPLITREWPEWKIPWFEIDELVRSGMLNVVRFHHEASIPWEHDHLMLDPGPIDLLGVPIRRTCQWSQRPHLARTDFYRELMAAFFTDHSRCMIEDTVLGAAETVRRDRDEWAKWRIGIFHPEGTIARSRHTDGRGNSPMFSMTFDYPGQPPAGAPQPGTRKVK